MKADTKKSFWLSKHAKWVVFLVFSLFFFLTRLPRLHNDTFNTDAVYWHDRSQEFMNGIKSGDFTETYQKYHPGVTTMWITSLSIEMAGVFTNQSPEDLYANPATTHHYIKIGFIVVQYLLTGLLFYLLSKIWDTKRAFFITLLFNLEPFFIGNSRLLHHDVQISLFLLIVFCFSFLYYQEQKTKHVVLAGIFLGLTVLTKTLFLGALVFVLGTVSILMFIKKQPESIVKFVGTVLGVFLLTYLALFPVMWAEPFKTVQRIFEESYHVGNEAGHKQIFYGEELRDPGPLFYLVLFGLKLSLVSLVGFIVYYITVAVKWVKSPEIKTTWAGNLSFETYITVFYIGYFLTLTFFSKKVDRYIVPFIPFISLIAVLGWEQLKTTKPILKRLRNLILILLAGYTIVWPLFKVFPHYLAYTNPIFGDAGDSNEIIGQKLFGIAVYDLRDAILDNYGEVSFAMHDYGPMRMIYREDKVYDISSEHPNSYSYIVLGPNKDFPDSFWGQGMRFPYKTSVFVNGLEFWRVYKVTY